MLRAVKVKVIVKVKKFFDYEEQGTLEGNHSDCGIDSDGSIDCTGHHELHEAHVNEKGRLHGVAAFPFMVDFMI